MTEFFELEIFKVENFSIKIYTFVAILAILLIIRLIIFLFKKYFTHRAEGKNETFDSYFALFQITRYIIWIIGIILILDTVGIKITILIAGSAALLVGVGLGLQQTFNDVMSGLILLMEGSTKVGDVLEIEDDVVKITNIGLRTSKALNRDDISIIIPNSLITTNKVINWSHQNTKARFRIGVGVAYGSDVEKVINVLVESANEHPDTVDKKMTHARLTDFGNSSLDFQVLFYSKNIFRIERIKSEIRRVINQKFIENGVTIPFPQVDLHIKSDNTKKAN